MSQDGIAPLPNNIEVVQRTKPPASLHSVQVFLEMVGCYRQFIPHFLELFKPLVHLLQSDVPFAWGEEQVSIFTALCKALASLPVLAPQLL